MFLSRACSFRSNFCSKRDSSSRAGFRRGLLWEREEPNRGTPLVRFPGLTISERAEAGTCAPFRERPSLRKREREGLVAYFFLFFLGICSSSSLFFCLWSKRDDDVEEKKLRRERGNTNNSQAGKHRTRCQIMETRDGSSECI